MNLDIKFDENFYKSDSIENGRIAKYFFKNLCSNMFHQAYNYATKIKKITGENELPLLFGERNIYSTLAVAIGKITPIHLSEWSFNTKDEDVKLDKQRIVDFWCLNKDGETGRPVNYFIEIKKGYYCLSSKSKEEITTCVKGRINGLISQLSTLKKIEPSWNEFDNVYLGALVTHNYYNGDVGYGEENFMRSLTQGIDGRKGIQIIVANWVIPEDLKVQWERDKAKSISIVGFILSKKNI